MEGKTIAAISTARGQAGVGVIRVSGETAIEIVEKIFVSVSGKKLQETPGYTARYGKIFDKGECVDEAVVLVFRAPHSYTGENVVEISCHGGIFVTEQILRLVIENGARLAAPGEFTQRAFLNGKMGLTEAESVMDLIGAESAQAARAAVNVHEGALSRRIGKVKDNLVAVAAHLDAFMDYPEDEVPALEKTALEMSLQNARKDLADLLDTYNTGRVLREGVDTAIVGKPNVGKSTLMNAMLGCERCIVTDVPGTTRDLVEESLMLGNVKLRVSDTAGMRDTDDLVEKIGVEKAYKKLDEAQLVLAVFDSSRALEAVDLQLIEKIKGLKVIAVINKTDLPRKIDVGFIESELKNVVYMSAKNDDNLKGLRESVEEMFKINTFDSAQGILSNQRQYFAVKSAISGLDKACVALNSGITLDALAVFVEWVVGFLLELTGEKVTDTIISEVFSKFCVGK